MSKQLKRDEVVTGGRYLVAKLGEVEALEAGKQKIFVRVVETGEVAYVGYRQLRQVAKPAPVEVAARRPRPTIAQVMHSIELAEVRTIAPPRRWRISGWAKVAACVAGFGAGLAAGMGPVAALVGG